MTAHIGPATGGNPEFGNDELRDRQDHHVQVEQTQFEKTLERSAGIDEMPLADDHEREVILRALAIGYSIGKKMAWVVALILLASGLWWAGILIFIALSIPGIVASRYSRRHGADLFWQSGIARNDLSMKGLASELLIFTLIVGLIAVHAALGHPLISWGWATPIPRFDETLIWILGGVLVGAVTGWYFRRRKLKSKLSYSTMSGTKR